MREFEIFEKKKPWGYFRQFTHNMPSTVKVIFVERGEAFSLQYHNKRTEFWRVLKGNPDVTIGNSVIHAKAGDEFEIPPKTNHRVYSPKNDTELLEISYGDFDENDIIRIEDKYGRA